MRKVGLSGFIVLFSLAIFAQQLPEHKAKVFISEDGKTYINKTLPVYFKFSVSPDPDAENYLLRSDETPQYSNPMYLDTEGYNTFRSPSAVDTVTRQTVYPLRDVIYEVYADSKAPVTSISYGESKVYAKSGLKYLNGKAEIKLSASDATAGVEIIYYSLDSTDYKKYNSPIPISAEKSYNIQYFAVDNVGNIEKVKSENISLDKTQPITALHIEGDKHENIISGRSLIKLEASDKGIGVNKTFYTIDEGKTSTYTVPIMAKYLAKGEHTIRYYSEDKVANIEEEKTYTFYVDKTAPTIVEELVGTSFMANGKEFTSGRTQLKLVTFDNKAGVKEVFYSVNGEEFKKYEKPFYLSMSSGSLAVRTYAVDNVNNKSLGEEQSTRAKIPYIDLSGPSLKYMFTGPVFETSDTIFINKETNIVLKGNDNEAGMNRISYKINDKQTDTYQKPFQLKKEGYYKIFFEGADNVENTNNKEFNVFVDNEGPEVFASFSIASKGKERVDGRLLDTYPSHLVIFLSATDEKVGVDRIYYSINGTPEKPYAGLISNLKPGRYEVDLRAVDKLGNSRSETIKFGVTQ